MFYWILHLQRTYIFHLARYFTSSKYELDKSKYLFVISFVISSLEHLTSVTLRKHFQIKSFLFQLWRSSHYTFKMFIKHKFLKLLIIYPSEVQKQAVAPRNVMQPSCVLIGEQVLKEQVPFPKHEIDIIFLRAFPQNSAAKRSIGFTIGFYNHGIGPSPG